MQLKKLCVLSLKTASFLLMVILICPTVYAETIKIGGTGSALGTMRLLGNEFEKIHPEHFVKVVPSLGSSGGIKALKGGALDVAVAGRTLKPDEQSNAMHAFRYAMTPLIFVAHRAVPKIDLNELLIAEIYSGKKEYWSTNRPIRLVLRPQTEADTQLVKKISPTIEAAVEVAMAKEGVVMAITDTDAADQIEQFANSFGLSTLALVLSESRKLTIFTLNGVTPSVQSLADGSYPLFKECYLIVSTAPSAATQQFLEFFHGPQGQAILKQTGHLIDQNR